MKDKEILVYSDNYFRQISKKNMDQIQPSDMARAIHLPDVYEFMSMVESSMHPIRLSTKEDMHPMRLSRKEEMHHLIVDDRRLMILDRRACRATDSNRDNPGYCWAPVFVGEAGMTDWDYDQFVDKDERVFKFLPDKKKKYREAALWNRRRIQALISGNCTELPSIMTDTIGENTYWCLLGELVILDIIVDIPGMRGLFESAGDVPRHIANMQNGSVGPFAYLDSNILCPGKALKNFTYEDLLQPVYIYFNPDVVADQKSSDLYFRSYENWKANLESYGCSLYWR